MSIYGLFKLLRYRAALIAGTILVSLLAGAAVFFTRPALYEVFMLVEATQASGGKDAQALARYAVETGLLGKDLAKKTGQAVPRLKVLTGLYSRFVKIYAYVPLEEMEGTKALLAAAPGVLKEEFSGENISMRMAAPPSSSDSPAGPSRRQVMTAFFLLGLFAGLAAALWAEDRAGKRGGTVP